MSRIVPVVLVLSSLVLSPVFAQDTSTSERVKSASSRRATPVPVATPVPEKRSFFERLFGRRKPKPTPTPTPAPTPKPRKPRPTGGNKPTYTKPVSTTTKTRPDPASDKPAVTKKPAPTADQPPTTETPTPKPTPIPKPTTKKGGGKSGGSAAAKPPASDGSDPDVLDKQKYDAAKAKAADDPEIQALKQKADDAVSDDDAKKAQTAYNRALFAKMRKLDPAIKERIDKMEAALMKRLGSQPGR